ncbi:MAG: hypothetical protein K0S76_1935 [Herbinix sp.]|jgi:gamma-F420-2:alpha-L-glutamate ligase|nr:hypothetical protein [Herbinix sp.]
MSLQKERNGVHMTAWIIYFRNAAIYNKNYIQFYVEEGKKLGIHVRLILVEELEFGIENSKWYIRVNEGNSPYPDFVINRAIYPLLSKQFEAMGIRVFNNSFVAEICNDKAKTYQYLAKTGIRMVDSFFYKNEQLPSVIKQKLHKEELPLVIKAVDGHGGSQVFLLEASNEKTIGTILEGMKSSDVVVQPLTGSRYQDLRVYVIGREVIAGVLRTAKEGFKSNFSLGGEVCLYQLTEDERNIVDRIVREFDFDLVGIDFIIGDQGELIFNEIEDVVGSRMLYQCSDINIVELYLRYIKSRMN